MKSSISISFYKTFLSVIFLMASATFYAQEANLPKAKTGDFWEHVRFGGGFGLAVGNDYTDATIAPSAIYNFNEHFAFGTGLQFSRLKKKHYYSSDLYGGSLIGLYNPIEEIQFSLELEEVNVHNQYTDLGGNFKESFWNTGLFLGAGYQEGNVTIGARVNVLYDKDKNVYGSAFMPFVRAYF
ncbi:MAG TPA: hypothetical protein PKN96_10905 [Flavobacterium sp.]|uniref:hypothetical protein n=1 Tax=Flavobacterium sp. TaxID=239 RepID=UPI002B9A253B|nr:hypothetical protein [Flavobacterium sp.]HNP33790.1 hypothetical protein [Flavobacterium sp.]